MQIVLSLLFCAYVAVTLVQIIIWVGVYRRVGRHTDTTTLVELWPSVSVVVCARNGRADLEALVPHLLAQEYAGLWELIVVDDASTDDTFAYLQSVQNDRLRAVRLENKTIAGKKQALDLGIRTAQNEWILVTDADCLPTSQHWITHMMRSGAQTGKHLVLGFAPFVQRRGWLYAWQRFETCFTALLYFGWALAGKPYMGVGRNMAYRKSLYMGSGGFDQHLDLPSGDDDLFVNAIAQPDAVAVCMHPESFMYSEAKHSWPTYYRQKTRHFSTSPRYRPAHQWMLSVAGLSHSLHYLFMLLLFLAQVGTVIVFVLALIRIVIIILNLKPVLRRFHEQRLQKWVPVFDPFIAVYYTVFVPGILFDTFNKPRSWT